MKGWSDSKIEELLGVLWILTGTQLIGWWRGFFIYFGIANLVAALLLALWHTHNKSGTLTGEKVQDE